MWWHMFKCWAWSSWCSCVLIGPSLLYEVLFRTLVLKLLVIWLLLSCSSLLFFLFNPSQPYNSLDLLHVAIVPDDSPRISLGRDLVKKERMRLNSWACSKCSPGISSFDMALRAQLLCSLLALSRQLPHSLLPLSSLKPIHCVRSRHSMGNFEVYAWYAR
jgi:hypothetical protein